jgi:hypothetical protein
MVYHPWRHIGDGVALFDNVKQQIARPDCLA